MPVRMCLLWLWWHLHAARGMSAVHPACLEPAATSHTDMLRQYDATSTDSSTSSFIDVEHVCSVTCQGLRTVRSTGHMSFLATEHAVGVTL